MTHLEIFCLWTLAALFIGTIIMFSYNFVVGFMIMMVTPLVVFVAYPPE
jgi:hypothetical protein